MSRRSFHTYESYLGMAGNPVEWTDRYSFSDDEPSAKPANRGVEELPRFASYHSRVADLTPRAHELPQGSHPFPTRHATRTSSLMFNIADYSRQLVSDFMMEKTEGIGTLDS